MTFLLFKGNAYTLLLMAHEGSLKTERKNKVAALTEVQLTVSNYRRPMLFAPLTGGDAVSGFSHPYWAISADSTHSGAVRTLHKGEESGAKRWVDGSLDRDDYHQTFQSQQFLDVGGSQVAHLHLEILRHFLQTEELLL